MRSSLYRNGAVLTRRDRDGSDGGRVGVDLAPQDVGVVNARDLAGDDYRTLERSGFELLDQPLLNADIDFFSQEHVVNKYYGECAQIVQDATGAAKVFAFDHNVRSAAGKSSAKRISGGQQVQGPAHVVHGDYTLTSAPQRLRDLTKPPTGNDTFRALLDDGCTLVASDEADRALADGGRYAIINVWRNIADEPVQTNPLALCDARSVSPEDLVVFEIHYHDRIGENYFAKHTPQHRWFFYPEMTRDEALLIKQWDSAGAFARTAGDHGDASDAKAPCTFSFHSAFEDPLTPADAPERWSIEVRCVALYT
ncbi:MAG: hypothetical protein K0U93_13415 [Gammaproteobacteria bacterium]|nr:hypothetical protein [Gammaproteobacteria bacterium]